MTQAVARLSLLLAIALAGSAAAQKPVVLDPANLDPQADPCQDFYQYACGGWIRRHPVPADRSSRSSFSLLQDRNRDILHDILEKAAVPNPGRSAIEQKIGDHYAS